MAEEGINYALQAFQETNLKIRDLEEKQNILKERILLIGKNLIEVRESGSKKTLALKKDIEILKQNIEKIMSHLENVSGELSKFARKEDLEILTKQAKMFQPLEFVRKSNLKK